MKVAGGLGRARSARRDARGARWRGDREQQVVELNAKASVRDERNKKQESLEVKSDPEAGPYTRPTLKLP